MFSCLKIYIFFNVLLSVMFPHFLLECYTQSVMPKNTYKKQGADGHSLQTALLQLRQKFCFIEKDPFFLRFTILNFQVFCFLGFFGAVKILDLYADGQKSVHPFRCRFRQYQCLLHCGYIAVCFLIINIIVRLR